MDDSLFGPWRMDPPVNKWNEWRIGKTESWYSISANCLQPSASNDKISSRSASGREGKSMIPKPSKRSARQQQEQSSINEEYDAPETVEKVKPQPRFAIREAWEDPHSFERFVSSPTYQLLGWPTKSVTLEEAISSCTREVTVKPPPGKSPKQRRSMIPTKR